MDTTPTLAARIAERIEETQQQIQALESCLAHLVPQKQALLGAEVLDEAALAQLNARGNELMDQADQLRERLTLLGHKQEEAEQDEARARVTVIVARVQQIATETTTTLATYQKAESALTRTVEKLATLHQEAGDLTEEMAYLCDRYQVPWQELADIGRLPNREDAAARIFDRLRLYWLKTEHGRNEWTRRREAWEKEQQHRATERAA
jgi:chromosome segregation ATPase